MEKIQPSRLTTSLRRGLGIESYVMAINYSPLAKEKYKACPELYQAWIH